MLMNSQNKYLITSKSWIFSAIVTQACVQINKNLEQCIRGFLNRILVQKKVQKYKYWKYESKEICKWEITLKQQWWSLKCKLRHETTTKWIKVYKLYN